VRSAAACRFEGDRRSTRPDTAGKCFLDMLGVFAEFETNLRRERQLEGIVARLR
jgi:DNA invertase Pin-like site-specific DNA recombinase